MKKPSFNRQKLKDAMVGLRLAEIQKLSGGGLARDDVDATAFIDALEECGGTLVRHPNAKQEAARGQLVNFARGYLAAFPKPLKKLESFVTFTAAVEVFFRDILTTVAAADISQRPAAVQIWSTIEHAHFAAADIRTKLKQLPAEPGPVNLSRPFVKDLDGYEVNADAVIWAMTHGTGTTMQMLAYQNHWFDSATGEIVLPVPTPAVENSVNEAGALLLLALTWHDLTRGWDRVRFFGGGYRVYPVKLPVGEPPADRTFEVLQFGDPGQYELYDRIATARLGQNFFQYATPLLLDPEAQKEIRALDGNPVQLPGPGNFISIEELAAFGVLREVMCLPVTEDHDHGGGLSLKEWLRGYAFLSVAYAEQQHDEADFILLPRADIKSGLVSVGLSDVKADQFIRHVSFGKASRDLFDEPLVRLADGRYFLYAPAMRSPNLGNIVLSRIGPLGCDFSERGPKFEAAVIREFRNAGLPAEGGFKYRVNGTEFECDAAVLWDKQLFVFECKNYTLPFGHLPTLAHFRDGFHGAAIQADRTAGHFRANPKLVPAKISRAGKWTKIIPCILYALPWGMGKFLEKVEIYSIDASALSRFLNDGIISVIAPRKHSENVMVQRRHHKKLWTGDKPSAQDFLRQLEKPAQNQIYLDSHTLQAMPRQVSETRLVVLPGWTEKSMSPEEMIRALGISSDEAKAVVTSFKEFHAAADAALGREKAKTTPAT